MENISWGRERGRKPEERWRPAGPEGLGTGMCGGESLLERRLTERMALQGRQMGKGPLRGDSTPFRSCTISDSGAGGESVEGICFAGLFTSNTERKWCRGRNAKPNELCGKKRHFSSVMPCSNPHPFQLICLLLSSEGVKVNLG